MSLSQWIIVAALAYFVVQIVRDFRRGDYLMAGIGFTCLVALMVTPLPTHAVLIGPLSPN